MSNQAPCRYCGGTEDEHFTGAYGLVCKGTMPHDRTRYYSPALDQEEPRRIGCDLKGGGAVRHSGGIPETVLCRAATLSSRSIPEPTDVR